jgi:hypothetical protein
LSGVYARFVLSTSFLLLWDWIWVLEIINDFSFQGYNPNSIQPASMDGVRIVPLEGEIIYDLQDPNPVPAEENSWREQTLAVLVVSHLLSEF